jgi:hypothetical protein
MISGLSVQCQDGAQPDPEGSSHLAGSAQRSRSQNQPKATKRMVHQIKHFFEKKKVKQNIWVPFYTILTFTYLAD